MERRCTSRACWPAFLRSQSHAWPAACRREATSNTPTEISSPTPSAAGRGCKLKKCVKKFVGSALADRLFNFSVQHDKEVTGPLKRTLLGRFCWYFQMKRRSLPRLG